MLHFFSDSAMNSILCNAVFRAVRRSHEEWGHVLRYEIMISNDTSNSVAIVGAGSIGTGWAIVFADSGFDVRICDSGPERLAAAESEIEARLSDLQAFGLLNRSVADTAARITYFGEMKRCIDGVAHVQECITESLEAKEQIFSELDGLASDEVVLASSSSFLPASSFSANLPGRSRILVVHPANPPFLLRIAEIVSAPFTDPAVAERTAGLLANANIASVSLNREIEGFAYNRLQGALLREAYCLVQDGIISAGDIDCLVRDALGLRWSVIGPFETADLNSRGGIGAHARRMGPAYARMGRERDRRDPWASEVVAEVTAARREALPISAWQNRVGQRDRALMAILGASRRDPALAIAMKTDGERPSNSD